MSGPVVLTVGSFMVRPMESASAELLAVFLGSMLQDRQVPVTERPRPAVIGDEGVSVGEIDSSQLVRVSEFRAPGRVIADRLDLMGFDKASTLSLLDSLFRTGADVEVYPQSKGDEERIAKEILLLRSLTGRQWVDLLKTANDDVATDPRLTPGTRSWLLGQIEWLDVRVQSRAYLLAFPDSEVVLDVTGQWPQWWELEDQAASMPRIASANLASSARIHAPVIVLTEGSTDAEFLSQSLRILYPHLLDLIKFLDYGVSPESNASTLARIVKSFAAANVINRVVAIFDNDATASKELSSIDQRSLPSHIKVLQYPTLELARDYPTIGPPSIEYPGGSENRADVNGLGASIELYLGRDVLAQDDGSLTPIEWKSLNWPGGGIRYQGEVVNKRAIQEKFRQKYARADLSEDWTGLELILNAIRVAAESAPGVNYDELLGAALVSRAIPKG